MTLTTDQHPAAAAISNINNARALVAALLEEECAESTYSYLTEVERMLSEVPPAITETRAESLRTPFAAISAAHEEERVSLMEDLRLAQAEIARLQAYADRVTERNSELMQEKAAQQRKLETHTAQIAAAVEVVSEVFHRACQLRDAARPSTRPYVPTPHTESPRVVAAGAAS